MRTLGTVASLKWAFRGSTAIAVGPTGDGILLEDGSSFLLAENGDYIILE